MVGLLARVARFVSREGGGRIEAARAAVETMPPDFLQDAFLSAMAKALAYLSLRTKQSERESAAHLEVALACAERRERLEGGPGGAEFRVEMRPCMVQVLYAAEAVYGEMLRRGEIDPEIAMQEVLSDLQQRGRALG